MKPDSLTPEQASIVAGITNRVLSVLSTWALGVIVLMGSFALFRNINGWGLDDTDSDGWNRSGLTIHTDHKTGVQYLSDGNGGMCIRVDAEGRPITARSAQ